MKIIEFEQGSKEWHDWRASGVGASDISIIMGSNPYKTPLQLWEVKCGFRKDDPINPAMRHGIENEDMVRQRINKLLSLNLQPLCVECELFPFMKASLDGYDFKHEVVCEIKCPTSEKILNNARDNQSIPEYWFDQMQWQISIAYPKRAFIVLWDYRTDELIMIEQFRIQDRIEKMEEEAKLFWAHLQSGITPAMQKGDYEDMDDQQLKHYLDLYYKCSHAEKEAKKKKENVKMQILEFCKGKQVKCNGFVISKSDPRNIYDMEKMKEDGIDLEKYKKAPGAGGYRITSPRTMDKRPLC